MTPIDNSRKLWAAMLQAGWSNDELVSHPEYLAYAEILNDRPRLTQPGKGAPRVIVPNHDERSRMEILAQFQENSGKDVFQQALGDARGFVNDIIRPIRKASGLSLKETGAGAGVQLAASSAPVDHRPAVLKTLEGAGAKDMGWLQGAAENLMGRNATARLGEGHTKLIFHPSIVKGAQAKADAFRAGLRGRTRGYTIGYDAVNGYFLDGPDHTRGFLGTHVRQAAIEATVAFYEENGLGNCAAAKAARSGLRLDGTPVPAAEAVPSRIAQAWDRVAAAFAAGTLSAGYDFDAGLDTKVAAINAFKNDLCLLALNGELSLESDQLEAFRRAGFDIDGLLRLALKDAHNRLDNRRDLSRAGSVFVAMAAAMVPSGLAALPTLMGNVHEAKDNLQRLEGVMNDLGVRRDAPPSIAEFVKQTIGSVTRPFKPIRVDPAVQAKYFRPLASADHPDDTIGKMAAKAGATRFEITAAANLGPASITDTDAVVRYVESHCVKHYEALRRDVPAAAVGVKKLFYMGPDGGTTTVVLIGGKTASGGYHFIDPTTGASFRGKSVDEICRNYAADSGLPPGGRLAFATSAGTLDTEDVPYSAARRAADIANGLAVAVGTVAMFVPGGQDVSMVAFGVSAAITISEFAHKLSHGESVSAGDILSLVSELAVVGGLGKMATMLGKSARAFVAGSKSFTELSKATRVLVRSCDAASLTGMAAMGGAISYEGVMALAKRDPEAALLVLKNLALLVAAHNVQSFYSGHSLRAQVKGVEKKARQDVADTVRQAAAAETPSAPAAPEPAPTPTAPEATGPTSAAATATEPPSAEPAPAPADHAAPAAEGPQANSQQATPSAVDFTAWLSSVAPNFSAFMEAQLAKQPTGPGKAQTPGGLGSMAAQMLGKAGAAMTGLGSAVVGNQGKIVTLGDLVALHHLDVEGLSTTGGTCDLAAKALLAAHGMNLPTDSQVAQTSYAIAKAVKSGRWEDFTPSVKQGMIKREDNVADRLGNVFFEKTSFTDAQLEPAQLRMESDVPLRDFASGRTGMIMAASFIHSALRSEGDFSHAYGEAAWSGFVRASTFLDGIPKGQFLSHLDEGLVSEVNRKIHAPDTGMKAKLLRAAGMIGRGGRWDKGGEIRAGSQFARPATYTPEQVAQIQAKGIKFILLNKTSDGKLHGMMQYPPPGGIKAKLGEIIDELKTDLAQPNADPVRAAAKFMQSFVALHPFGDSNGRTGRIIMNRVLAEYDMPPAVLENQDSDLEMSLDAWRHQVAEGVARSKRFLETATLYRQDWVLEREDISVAPLPNGVGETPVVLDGNPFIRGNDGFLYDPTGRPWLVEGHDVVPLAQLDYYVLSRRLMQLGPDEGSKRLREITADTTSMLEKIAADPAAGKDIVVRPDAEVRAADAAYQLAPEPEIAKILVGLTNVSGVDPSTLFGSGLFAVGRVAETKTMSRYQQIDLELWYLEKGLRKTKQNGLAAEVRQQRDELFRMAKTRMAAVADPEYKSATNPYGFRRRYEQLMFEHSPLRFASLEQAIEATGDNTTTVWRGDYGFARVLGMAPNNDIRQPDAKAVARQRSRKGQLTNLNDDLSKLEEDALGRQYICTTSDLSLLVRAFAGEQKSQTINLSKMPKAVSNAILKWIGSGKGDQPESRSIADKLGVPGTFLEFTIVNRAQKVIRVTAFRRAFMLRLPKDALLPGIQSLGGGYEREQELHGLERVHPWQVKGVYEADKLMNLLRPPNTNASADLNPANTNASVDLNPANTNASADLNPANTNASVD